MRLPQLPAWLLWDHNAHYHNWLLRRLPVRCRRALDAGSGVGASARLPASRVGTVDAVDRSQVMIGPASAAGGRSSVRWPCGDLLDPSLPVDPDGYDLLTALSSLHHMPLRPALARLAALVHPDGSLPWLAATARLALATIWLDAFAIPATVVVGAVLAIRGRTGSRTMRTYR